MVIETRAALGRTVTSEELLREFYGAIPHLCNLGSGFHCNWILGLIAVVSDICLAPYNFENST